MKIERRANKDEAAEIVVEVTRWIHTQERFNVQPEMAIAMISEFCANKKNLTLFEIEQPLPDNIIPFPTKYRKKNTEESS